MIAGNRLCLLTVAVLLVAVQTLQAAAPKPDRGSVRFADDQHIPVRPKAVAEPSKPKSSSPGKTKKPTTPAQADAKKKTPVKPSVAAATAKKSPKPVDDKYRSEFEEYMRQQIQQWQIAVVNGQPISPPAGSQPSGQPPSSVWIQVPANGYYPPPSYPYPQYPQPSYPPPSYPPPSYPPPSYPPPSYPQPSYPPPSYPPPAYPQPPQYPQPSPYPPPSPYPQQPLYPPQPAPSPVSEESELSTPAPSEGSSSQPETPEVVTTQPEYPSPPAPGYPSPPAPEYPSPPAPEYPPTTSAPEYPPSTSVPEYPPSTPAPESGTPPPGVSEPELPEITQAPEYITSKPESSTDLPEVIPTYPETQQPEQPGVPVYPGQPEEVPTTVQPETSSEASTDQPAYPGKPSSETPGEEPEVTTSAGTTYSPDPDVPSPTGPPSTDALKAQCKEPRGQFPSESSCNKFINCWDETAVEQTCPAGLVFNPEKRYCDYPANVDCGSRPITVGTENGNNTKCPDGYGTYRSTENCGAFYVCVAGSPVDFVCPGGTNYNDDLKICDYPYRVDCKGLPNNPEPIETATETEINTTYAPEISSTTPNVPLSSAESSPATEVVPTSSTSTTIAPVADPVAIYNYNLRKIPPSMVNTGVRCSHKSIYRLTPDCSSVTLCRNGFTHILNCAYATSYDIGSQKCLPSQRANCGRSA